MSGVTWGKIRAMINDENKNIDLAIPSTPVEILGMNNSALAGDDFVVVSLSAINPKGDKKLETVIEEIKEKIENEKNEYLKKNLFNINTKMFVDNNMSNKHTILEINTFDRIGLIYDLTKKLYRLGLQINSAKILSLGAGATNIFYIQDKNGKKIFSIHKLNFLKKKILFIVLSNSETNILLKNLIKIGWYQILLICG